MKTINTRELRKRFELDGPQQTVDHLTEALQSGDLKPEDFSLRDLAEGLIPDGNARLRELDPRSGRSTMIHENDSQAFLNVTGAIIETRILDSYNKDIFAVSKLISTIPTRFDGEKIHSGSLPDGATEIQPGDTYPTVGFGEDYIETPGTTKRGLIVPVTKEAIFFDRTHLVLGRAAEVGEALALNKEKRVLKTVLGIENTYKFNGAAGNTYYGGAASDPWKNSLTGNALVDWSNIDAAENMLALILDPTTNEPILAEPDSVLVMPTNRHIAYRLFYASELTHADMTGSSVSAVPNPFSRYNLVSSRLALRLLEDSGETNPNSCWFIGNFAKAFAYMENWPITVTQSAPGGDGDFSQDIVVRYKASERGTPAVLNPRYVAKCAG